MHLKGLRMTRSGMTTGTSKAAQGFWVQGSHRAPVLHFWPTTTRTLHQPFNSQIRRNSMEQVVDGSRDLVTTLGLINGLMTRRFMNHAIESGQCYSGFGI